MKNSKLKVKEDFLTFQSEQNALLKEMVTRTRDELIQSGVKKTRLRDATFRVLFNLCCVLDWRTVEMENNGKPLAPHLCFFLGKNAILTEEKGSYLHELLDEVVYEILGE